MKHNTHKKALITGSSAGIGAEIATILAKNGYEIFITGRNQERTRKLADKINAKAGW